MAYMLQALVLTTLSQSINIILRKDASKFYGEGKVRLADTYEKLPDFRGFKVTKGTKTPINPAWRSPFVGKTLRRRSLLDSRHSETSQSSKQSLLCRFADGVIRSKEESADVQSHRGRERASDHSMLGKQAHNVPSHLL